MINKKFSMIAVVLVLAVGVTAYGIYELVPLGITIVSGNAQYADWDFDQRVEKHAIVVEGTIKDVQIKTFVEEIMETDADGNETVFDSYIVPRAEITIDIKDIFKDNYGLDSKTVTVYDRYVKDGIGLANGERARFVSHDAIDYAVGDNGIFLIENDKRLWLEVMRNPEINDGTHDQKLSKTHRLQ